jgi:hypothetical protein
MPFFSETYALAVHSLFSHYDDTLSGDKVGKIASMAPEQPNLSCLV